MYIAFRDPAERLSVSQRVAVDNTITEFNGWVSDLEVEEVQCVGRKFTWYRPNGAAKSKLDRFFVSDAWISKWPGSTSFILNRNFSDHCPVLLRSRIVDWGPQPFKVLDCWLNDKTFENLVKGSWTNLQIRGWGDTH